MNIQIINNYLKISKYKKLKKVNTGFEPVLEDLKSSVLTTRRIDLRIGNILFLISSHFNIFDINSRLFT